MLVPASKVRNNFSKYLKQVSGENKEIIITKNNVKVARLVPYITDLDKYFTIRENAVDYNYNHRKVSYEEFMEIYENSNARMEYINGEIFLLSSPSVFHQAVLGDLYTIFKEYFKKGKCRVFTAPFDVHFRKTDIDVPDVMQPDLLVICDIKNNINEKGKYMGTPTLTLEIVSPNTKRKDMVLKLNTYMRSGVAEYWIVEPENRRITIYNFINYEIDKNEVYKAGEIAKSIIFERLEIDVGYLFEQGF
ncbi:MAG TPA: type II toxin-antitoxin system Phd/YefM family antitoxin [Clostridiaceae bacterium]|nr:type II toxin-antitoxin system Phd/YefM family antitoxin [Clostridiaceae bacterium]